ncbi:MAG TPA: hypothetical protein VK778_08595 [Solirubrobacteraceae bacterium]|nr:hypothetical protein [Solirubrobacteraceae bacterium]
MTLPDLINASRTDEHGEMGRSIFESPEGFLAQAVARNKLLVLFAALAFAVAGAGVGASRNYSSSAYSAAATLQVGQVNPNSPGFYGYVQSSAALATAFSRAVTAEDVLSTVHERLSLTPAQASARLSAAPIPQSPAFRVIATGPTEAAAIRLANVAAASVISYVSEINSANPEATSLLREYRSASIELHQAVARVTRLKANNTASETTQLTAEADVSAAGVKVTALGSAYTAAISSQAPRSGLVTLIAGATTATNDKGSGIVLYGLIGLLVGIVLGCAGAVVRYARRRVRHEPSLPPDVERASRSPV